jgi:hypothetical protein
MAGPRSTAQARADRIHAFQEELAYLQHEGLLVLAPDQQQHLAAHHGQLLQALAREFDVDTTAGQKQMSLGMGVVSFLGHWHWPPVSSFSSTASGASSRLLFSSLSLCRPRSSESSPWSIYKHANTVPISPRS